MRVHEEGGFRLSQLLSRGETNSIYYIYRFFRLLLSFNNTNSDILHDELDGLISFFNNNPEMRWDLLGDLSNEGYRKIIFYFLDYGAATPLTLEVRLGIYEQKVYRYIKKLLSEGIIQLAIKMPKFRASKGGPRPSVYKTVEATPDQIHEAANLHRRLTSPKYRYAEEMAQLMMDEYISKLDVDEISEKDYMNFLKSKGVRSPMIPDIVTISISYFRERGVKLWRGSGRKFS